MNNKELHKALDTCYNELSAIVGRLGSVNEKTVTETLFFEEVENTKRAVDDVRDKFQQHKSELTEVFSDEFVKTKDALQGVIEETDLAHKRVEEAKVNFNQIEPSRRENMSERDLVHIYKEGLKLKINELLNPHLYQFILTVRNSAFDKQELIGDELRRFDQLLAEAQEVGQNTVYAKQHGLNPDFIKLWAEIGHHPDVLKVHRGRKTIEKLRDGQGLISMNNPISNKLQNDFVKALASANEQLLRLRGRHPFENLDLRPRRIISTVHEDVLEVPREPNITAVPNKDSQLEVTVDDMFNLRVRGTFIPVRLQLFGKSDVKQVLNTNRVILEVTNFEYDEQVVSENTRHVGLALDTDGISANDIRRVLEQAEFAAELK